MSNARAYDEQVSVKLRFAILSRDKFTCQYCGRTADDGIKLHVDHIFPVAEGGKSLPDNLLTSCQDCNLGKGRELIGDPISMKRKGNLILVKKAREKKIESKELIESLKNEIEAKEEEIIKLFIDGQKMSLKERELAIILKRTKEKIPNGYRHLIGIMRGLLKI